MPYRSFVFPLIALLLVGLGPTSLADGDTDKTGPGPVKVFLLIGQSNMNGRGNIQTLETKLIKDLPEQYPPALMKLRKDVWLLGANGDGISKQTDNKCLEPGFGQWKWYGPELGFGHRVGNHFKEQVLIIKVFGGGTSLGKNWVSPSMAKRTGRPVGHMYKRMVRETIEYLQNLDQHYRDYKPEMGYQLCGAFWVQGHADGGSFRDEYEDNLVDLINDTRANLGVADLPFIAAESLAGKPPGEAYQNAVDRVNKQAGNKQAVAILTKSKIRLREDEKYTPYNSAGDSTHWLHNSRAFLDIGYWAADLTMPLMPKKDINHAKDEKVQATWKAILPAMQEEEGDG